MELYLDNKQEWSTDTCYNMDKPWKDAKWKERDTKSNILYYSIYMKCSK